MQYYKSMQEFHDDLGSILMEWEDAIKLHGPNSYDVDDINDAIIFKLKEARKQGLFTEEDVFSELYDVVYPDGTKRKVPHQYNLNADPYEYADVIYWRIDKFIKKVKYD